MINRIKFLSWLIFLTGMTVLSGCAKQPEKIALEETVQENDDTKEAANPPEITPVIQVQCNCDCNCGKQTSDNQEASASLAESSKININTADETELQKLTGIGLTRAKAIIAYRNAYGKFQSVEDIKNVEGIKDGVYQKIQNDIAIE